MKHLNNNPTIIISLSEFITLRNDTDDGTPK